MARPELICSRALDSDVVFVPALGANRSVDAPRHELTELPFISSAVPALLGLHYLWYWLLPAVSHVTLQIEEKSGFSLRLLITFTQVCLAT